MTPPTPRVSFVVTCYKMAHTLAECLTSILAQSYRDYEVLIMDDCSPDQTPTVAARFRDSRVRYIRSSVSLGQVKNCNDGLRRARGEYVWLISAEDRLSRPYVLQRFVELLDRHPKVGLAFCPGVTIDRDGREGEIHGSMGEADAIIAGQTFLSSLIESNCICRPAVLARRTCYERMGLFPIDLPYAGHWYVWCFIALHSDVAYFGEPMVNDRRHPGNTTRLRAREMPHVLIPDVINLRQRLKRLAEERGLPSIVRACSTLLAAVDVSLGDDRFDSGEFLFARHYYIRALRQNPRNIRTLAKVVMTCLGTRGAKLRRMMGASRPVRSAKWESSFGPQPL